MKRNHLIALLMTTTFASCSGGSGNSPIPTTVQPQHALRAGFTAPHGAASNIRAIKDLSAVVVPVVNFIVPPAFIPKGLAPISFSATAIAFYPLGSIPATIPTGSWTETGVNVPITNLLTPSALGQGGVSGAVLAPPSTDGKTTYTFTASNGDVAAIASNSYRGIGVSVADPNGPNSIGLNLCAAFNADGSAIPSSTGDICLSSDGKTLTLQRGGALVKKTIDQVGVTDLVGLPTTSTTIAASSVIAAQNPTVIVRDAAGGIDKVQLFPQGIPTATNDSFADAYGPYRHGSALGWDF